MATDDSLKKQLKRRNKTPKNNTPLIHPAMSIQQEKSHDKAIDKKIKKKKKTSGEVLEKASSKTSEASNSGEKNHGKAIDKKIEKKKNKKISADVLENVSPQTFEVSDTGDEAREATQGNKKHEESRNKKRKNTKLAAEDEQEVGKKMKKVKRKCSVEIQRIDDSDEPNIPTERDDEDVGRMIEPGTVDHMTISERLEGKERRSKTGKSKKTGKLKKKNKSLPNDVAQVKVPEKQESAPETEVHAISLDKQEEAPEVEVYEMSSGDEDYSKGMTKWIMQYHQSRPGIKVLQERIDDIIMDLEAKKEQARKEHQAEIEKDGFTVVVHHRGRKKTTDAESGIAVGSVAPAAAADNMAKKKKKDVSLNFYRFQKREAQRSELMMLQSKFEQDKKWIQQLRAERKFRPY